MPEIARTFDKANSIIALRQKAAFEDAYDRIRHLAEAVPDGGGYRLGSTVSAVALIALLGVFVWRNRGWFRPKTRLVVG